LAKGNGVPNEPPAAAETVPRTRAPSIAKAVRILSYLADHPGERFRASALSREAGLSRRPVTWC
jgi:hypothetical protein